MTEVSQQRRNLVICLCLAVITGAIYWQVHQFQFVYYDDSQYVVENPHVRGGLSFGALVWALTTNRAANWHPLTWWSHMLDCQVFGLNAGAHHLVNLLFHVANTLLLFSVLNRMTAAPWRSTFVAALFALHPLHVESVAWIAERKDVLSTCLWMLAIGAYVRYVETCEVQGSRFRVHYGLALLFFVMGLMAKPMVVTLPFVLLLLDYWPLARTRWTNVAGRERAKTSLSQLLKEKLPFFALAGVSCGVTFWAQHTGGAVVPLDFLPVGERVANAMVSYVRYLGRTLWPSGLAAFYPYQSWRWDAVVGAVTVLGCVTGWTLWRARREPHFVVGWLWYMGTLVPVIGLVQVGIQAMADRYTYLPLIGLFVMLAWGVPDSVVERPVQKVAAAATAALLLAVCAALSWFQIRYWKTSEALFRHALSVTADNFVAHSGLGSALLDQGKLAEASWHFEQALRAKPDYAEAENDWGIALQRAGRIQEAIEHYEQALRLKPGLAGAHNDFGTVLARLGRIQEAIEHYEQALRLKPDFAEAQCNLGDALAGLGKVPEALTCFEKALRLKPGSAETHNNLGNALFGLGRIREAIAHYEEALRIQPNQAEASGNLAWLLATLAPAEGGDPVRAVTLAQRACQLDGSPVVEDLDTLAVAYAAAGRFDEAVAAAEKAIEVANSSGQPELAGEIKNQLATYRNRRPYDPSVDATNSHKR